MTIKYLMIEKPNTQKLYTILTKDYNVLIMDEV